MNEVIGDQVIVKQELNVREDRAVKEAEWIKHEVIDGPMIVEQESPAEFTSVKLEDVEDVARAGGVETAEALTSVKQKTNDVARAGGVEIAGEFTSVKQEVTDDLARAGATKGEWRVLSRAPCSTCNEVHFNACEGLEMAVKREREQTPTLQSASEEQKPKRRRQGQAALQRSGLPESQGTAAIKQEGMQSSTAEHSRRVATPVRRRRHNRGAGPRYCHGCRCAHPYAAHVPRQRPADTPLPPQEDVVEHGWNDWVPSQMLAAEWDSWEGAPRPAQYGRTYGAAEQDWWTGAVQPTQREAGVASLWAPPQEPEIDMPLAVRQAIERGERIPREELFEMLVQHCRSEFGWRILGHMVEHGDEDGSLQAMWNTYAEHLEAFAPPAPTEQIAPPHPAQDVPVGQGGSRRAHGNGRNRRRHGRGRGGFTARGGRPALPQGGSGGGVVGSRAQSSAADDAAW
ncbi:hypothetical protein LTR95_008142 [Oleoguttula sp. CCFEE 5521]